MQEPNRYVQDSYVERRNMMRDVEVKPKQLISRYILLDMHNCNYATGDILVIGDDVLAAWREYFVELGGVIEPQPPLFKTNPR